MTLLDIRTRTDPVRRARPRRYLMCPPAYFAVRYAINPWMDPSIPVDVDRAGRQWEALADVYRGLGHRVDVVEPLADNPDMVFAANGATVVGDRGYGARFRYPQRQAEAVVFARALEDIGVQVSRPTATNEGEGDFLVLGGTILAGTGFRTSRDAHAEAELVLGRPVVSLELVDPRFYHLDVALAVLDDGNGEAPADIAYLPEAFSPATREHLRELFPDALEAPLPDALRLGLNLVSDGEHIVLPTGAETLAGAIADRGYTPIEVELDELLKSGGSVKCCTLERHR